MRFSRRDTAALERANAALVAANAALRADNATLRQNAAVAAAAGERLLAELGKLQAIHNHPDGTVRRGPLMAVLAFDELGASATGARRATDGESL